MHWEKFSNILPISDYTPYTAKEFVEIESSSSVVIKALFTYFIYTIPENILVCCLLYFIFKLLKKYEISKHIRRYYFIKSVLLQTLIEGNISYFAYVSFGHLSNSFSFKFYDKQSLIFCLLFIWAFFLYSLVYYPLVGCFLKKKACYFIEGLYRYNSSYLFLTVKNLVRNLIRGAIFYFLHEFYLKKLLLLSLV